MPVAAVLLLLKQYGPAALALAMKYGPELVAIIKKAQVDGTLERDVARIVAMGQRLGPWLSTIGSLSSLADTLDGFDIRPAQPEDPVMQRASGHTGMGGR